MIDRARIEDLVHDARLALADDRIDDGVSQARAAATEAREAGFGDLEFLARWIAVLGTMLRDDAESALEVFTGLTQLVVDLGRPVGATIDEDLSTTILFTYAYAANRVVPGLADVLQIIDAGESHCHRIGRAEHALRFQHARSKLFIDRREYAMALPVARRALERRRVTYDERAANCEEACYIDAVVDALGGLGRISEAFEVLDDAIGRDRTNARLLAARGDLHLIEGHHSSAIADYDAAMTMDDDAEHRLRRAIARAAEGDMEGARADLYASQAQHPRGRDVVCWLAAAGEPTETAGRGTSWSDRVVGLLRGEVSEDSLLADAARKPYADPYLAHAWTFVGIAAERRGDTARAREAYQQALALAAYRANAFLWAAARTRRLATRMKERAS